MNSAPVLATVSERVNLAAGPRNVPGDVGGGAPTARDILAMLRRRLVLIVFLFFLLMGVTSGGFAVWWVYFPGYQAAALIECISNIPDAGLTVEQQRLKEDEHERFVLSQALLLKSPSILGEALKVTAVRETNWYRSVSQTHRQWYQSLRRRDPLLELTEDLVAAPVRGTNFLRVAMETHKLTDAAIIVNEVVNQWFETVKKRTAEEFTEEALQAAQREMTATESEITGDRDRLKSIAERLPAGARLDPDNITSQQVKQYGDQVAQLQLELSQLEAYRRIYNEPGSTVVTADDRNAIELDPEVAEAARNLFLLQQRRAADARVYGAEHAAIKQIDAMAAATEEELNRMRAERLAVRRADMREATNSAYDNTRHALFLAEENLLRAEAALQDQDRQMFEYTNLEADIQRKIDYLTELTEYVKSLARIKNQRTAIRVNIAQAATDPLEKHSPSLWLVPMAAFLSLFVSLGIALGLEMLDTSVRTTQDITRQLDIALLGVIPDTDDEEVAIRRVETAFVDAPRSMVAEAFRRIRTNLQFSAPAEAQRTVLITSAKPEDGKTTVACNLAMAIAQAGRRVLLVDANFRRPGIQRIFAPAKPQGLSNLLIGEGSLDSLVTSTSIPALNTLSSGPIPPNPAELLGSERCLAFLQEARSRYDQVIIDSAPLLIASDATVLATQVDGTILVVRARQNSRGVARRAYQLLADVGTHVFGAVLNAAQVSRGGYFREQLRTYYDYQSALPSGSPPPSKK